MFNNDYLNSILIVSLFCSISPSILTAVEILGFRLFIAAQRNPCPYVLDIMSRFTDAINCLYWVYRHERPNIRFVLSEKHITGN